jgi:hypothetical protein
MWYLKLVFDGATMTPDWHSTITTIPVRTGMQLEDPWPLLQYTRDLQDCILRWSDKGQPMTF